jgi:dienelactone hydrolase
VERVATGGARPLAVLVASIAGIVLAGCGGQQVHHARVSVAPASSLSDQPVHIMVSEVGSDRGIAVALQSVDAKGHAFVSRATFRSNGSGRVDLATSPATAGSYRGVDPMGLIDTLAPVLGQSGSYVWGGRHPQRFRIIVSEAGSKVASGGFIRSGRAPGVTMSNESIATTGFYGQFWTPRPGIRRRPGVLIFGGSEGGLDFQLLGAALASAGYPTLDVAYFGEPGLPSALRDIPLEYFAGALRWLARQPQVIAKQIYVAGVSRGSEAALLLGVHYPKLVHGVIASSPSDVSFGSYPDPGSAAWTYHGKPVPYSSSFSAVSPTVDPRAEIAVQQIHGPVLLDCGTADEIWTSCAYAQAIQNRLNAAHDRFPHVLYRFSGAGHLVGDLIAYQPGGTLERPVDQGDTALANDDGDARLWPRVLSFLTNPAAQTRTITAPATPPQLTTP